MKLLEIGMRFLANVSVILPVLSVELFQERFHGKKHFSGTLPRNKGQFLLEGLSIFHEVRL